MFATRKFVLAALLAATVPLSGCGGDDEVEGPTTLAETTPTPTSETPRRKPVEDTGTKPLGRLAVTESEFKLRLAKKKLSQSGVYTLSAKNAGKVDHKLASRGKNGTVSTKTIPPGGRAELKLYLAVGKYTLYCPIGNHEQKGMKATLTVKR